MSETLTHFGQLLLKAREAAGISRNDLAERTGLDSSHIYRIETGGRRPSRECALALAEALGIASEALDNWLLSAGYAPVPLLSVVRGAVRTRGGGRRPKGDVQTGPIWHAGRWAAWLEALGLQEAQIQRLLHAMEDAKQKDRLEIARAVSATFSRASAALLAPVHKAVIPAAGGHHQVVALPVMQRLLLRGIKEAAQSGISEIILILAPGMIGSLYLPLKEAMDPAIVPFVRLSCAEQPSPIGLGDAILRAEPLVGREPFAVLLPDDVVRERVGRTSQPWVLQRMMGAFAELGNAHLVAVTPVLKSKMSQCGAAKMAAQEVLPEIRPIVQAVEKPEPDHPILRSARTLGIVGRYLLHPEVFAALRTLEDKGDRPVELTAALEALLKGSRRVLGFELKAARQDVGEVLDYVEEIIDASLRGKSGAKRIAED